MRSRRCCCSPRSCSRSAATYKVAAAQVPGAGMSAGLANGVTSAESSKPQAARRAIESGGGRRSSPGPGAGAIGWCCVRMDGGHRAVPDRRGDRPLHGLSRNRVPHPEPPVNAPRDQHLAGPHRRHSRSSDRHAAADPVGIALAFPLAVQRDLDRRVRAGRRAPVARADRRVEHRDRRGHSGYRARAVRLAIFQLGLFAPLSFRAEGGGVYGRSFIAAGAMMSLIALPPLFVATRDGLRSVPMHMREAAFALGKTRIATIRRVLLPSVRSNIATGVTLGVSRIIGDTAIVCCCSARPCTSKRRRPCRCSACCAARARADQLRLRQLARRRRRRPSEGLRGGVRAVAVRARAESPGGSHRSLQRADHGDVGRWRDRMTPRARVRGGGGCLEWAGHKTSQAFPTRTENVGNLIGPMRR